MSDEQAGEQGRSARGAVPSWRAAAVMIVLGGVLLALTFVLPDERWRALAWVLGALLGGVGLLTLVYGRVAPHLPVPRKDQRSRG